MTAIHTADWHLKPETADTVFAFLDWLLEHALASGADRLVVLGDVWHVRYQVPVDLQNLLLEAVLRFVAEGVTVTFLPGNHDQVDVDGRNALEVLGERFGVFVMNEPTWDEDGLWLPFRRNVEELIAFVQNNPRPKGSPNVAHLHHGIVGAMMNTNVMAGVLDGIPPAVFKSFDLVLCGHWHRHQVIEGNIVYVGSPYQTRADEAGQDKVVVWLGDDGGWGTDPVPLLGKRFHRVAPNVVPVLDDVAPGDVVTFPEGTAPDDEALAQLRAKGVDIVVKPPEQKFEARFGLTAGASLREYAVSYVEARAEEPLSRTRLMRIFDEVAS